MSRDETSFNKFKFRHVWASASASDLTQLISFSLSWQFNELFYHICQWGENPIVFCNVDYIRLQLSTFVIQDKEALRFGDRLIRYYQKSYFRPFFCTSFTTK